MPSRSLQTLSALLSALGELGWRDAGETVRQTVRTPTATTPVYGASGGEVRTLGGRLRLALPGSDRRLSVGARTTCFYRIADGEAVEHGRFETAEPARIVEFARSFSQGMR